MAPRVTWKGFLNLSLVSVPVKAYTSSNSGGSITLNQLHAECNSRVNYKTSCPVCGDISRSDIVKGYQYAKDQYVVIDLDELEKLRTKDETRAIRIDKFVAPGKIDPVHYTDTHYYLLPDGPAGQKPYALLIAAMQVKDVECIAQVVLHNKEQLVLVRPLEGLLCMTVLKYATQVKSIEQFTDELNPVEVSDAELQLAGTLIDETTVDDLDLSEYTDVYTERLNQLIESKVEGKQLVVPPQADTPDVVDLMDALKASVAQSLEIQRDRGVACKSAASKKTKKKSVLAEELANPTKRKTKTKKKSG
ncbi:MAG: Ku protein [Planctomycetales bacterium]|nr:Ku protein [Planctomycetales bacterium]